MTLNIKESLIVLRFEYMNMSVVRMKDIKTEVKFM